MDQSPEFGELLSDAEIQRLTGGLKRPHDQATALRKLGIPAQISRGVVIASRVMMRQWLAGELSTGAGQINWNTVR